MTSTPTQANLKLSFCENLHLDARQGRMSHMNEPADWSFQASTRWNPTSDDLFGQVITIHAASYAQARKILRSYGAIGYWALLP